MNKPEIPSNADPGLPLEVAQAVAQATISRLKDWKLPDVCRRAAQWISIGSELSSGMADEAETAVILAGRVHKWYGSILALTERIQPEGPPPGAYSYLVRGLLREIYCDYPDFSFILLLFAYHDARLQEIPDEKMAEVTLGILAPLAEILGLWRLRREWLEQSTRILATSQGPWKRQLTETQRLVKRLHWHSLEELERLPAERRKRRANHTLDVKNWEVHNRRRTERAEFFIKLREILQDKANQAGFKAMPRIELRLFSPERLAGRAILEKAEPGEHLNRLWVRVFCATEAECYQMLGLAHSLGKPLGSGYSDHFEDYLVAAQPNGNRVLRTAFIFRPADYYTGFEYGGNVIVELRLLTENAHKVNEDGVVEVFYRQPDLCNDNNYRDAWWSPVQNKILLATINSYINSSSKDQSYQSVEEFLRQHEPGTRSPNLYVFTPKGQIRIMPDSSTALDFAYEIHSELGEHASQIKINQQPVSYDERLKNGDMVEVELDERFHGPDPSWLNFVSTALARKRIRRQLTRASKAVHPGRAMFNRQLIQTLTFYQEKRGFNLRFTGRQIDDFLLNYARARGKPDLKALFDSISVRRSVRNQITPQQIVHRLLSEVLANYLVDWFGEALPYPPYRINVCDNCRPVPGMPIVAFESGSPGYERLSVHARECEALLRDGNLHKRVTVKWASQRGKLSGGELLVHGRDRDRLVRDVLDCLHDMGCCRVEQVQAQVEEEDQAVIRLIVSYLDPANLSKVKQALGRVQSVQHVWFEPLPDLNSLGVTGASLSSEVYNPFANIQGYNRTLFYDREEPMKQLRLWLLDTESGNSLILHGQRRAGKTWLARHLEDTILRELRIVFPTYINLTGLSEWSLARIGAFLLESIAQRYNLGIPETKADTSPTTWVKRELETAAGKLGLPLMIILDEFDLLAGRCISGELPATILSNLTYIFQSCPSIRWLIILSDTYYQEPNLPEELVLLLQRTPNVQVSALPADYAYRYIREPAESKGLVYMEERQEKGKQKSREETNPLVQRIYSLTGGMPFYINRLCEHVISQTLQDGRTNIGENDLENGLKDFLLYGQIYFDHYLRPESRLRWRTLDAIVRTALSDGFTSVQHVIVETRRCSPELSADGVLVMLNVLERQGLISRQFKGDEEYVRFGVPLFPLWVRSYPLSEPNQPKRRAHYDR